MGGGLESSVETDAAVAVAVVGLAVDDEELAARRAQEVALSMQSMPTLKNLFMDFCVMNMFMICQIMKYLVKYMELFKKINEMP